MPQEQGFVYSSKWTGEIKSALKQLLTIMNISGKSQELLRSTLISTSLAGITFIIFSASLGMVSAPQFATESSLTLGISLLQLSMGIFIVNGVLESRRKIENDSITLVLKIRIFTILQTCSPINGIPEESLDPFSFENSDKTKLSLNLLKKMAFVALQELTPLQQEAGHTIKDSPTFIMEMSFATLALRNIIAVADNYANSAHSELNNALLAENFWNSIQSLSVLSRSLCELDKNEDQTIRLWIEKNKIYATEVAAPRLSYWRDKHNFLKRRA